ncbi:hypothetical protein B0I37DRAFT_363114 [Chaetomium sp. MPI-CAGE-AT-0009]|nr:hypothetical protein B0I37DRAFT_363114 [Chaetomium sp. MPI-CAGE-AT-0009]
MEPLEVAGAADVGISLVSGLVQAAHWLWQTAKDIQSADQNWENIRENFETEMMSQIRLLVDEVGYLIAENGLTRPEEASTLERMREKLELSSSTFRADLNTTRPVGRRRQFMFGIQNEENLRRDLQKLETSAEQLHRWLQRKDVLDRLRENAKGKMLSDRVLEAKAGGAERHVPGAKHCRTIEAWYRPNPLGHAIGVRVLVDDMIGYSEESMAILTGLLRRSERNASAGITLNQSRLQCLGFKGNALIFRLPEHAEEPKTLRARMLDLTQPKAALSERFAIAGQLVDAVVKLHATGVMHENLRSDTVLSIPFEATPDDGLSGLPSRGGSSATAAANAPPHQTGAVARKRSDSLTRLARKLSFKSLRNQSRRRGDKDDDNDGGNGSGTEERRGRRRSSLTGNMFRSARGGERQPPEEEAAKAKTVVRRSSFAVVLTHWSQAEECGAIPVSSIPPEDAWHLKVYRHPEQQRKQEPQADDRYNFGHDIYALGVCLLEIGLWYPLVRPAEDGAATLTRHLRSAGVDAVTDWLGCELAEALRNEGSAKLDEAVTRAFGKDAIINAPKSLLKSVVNSPIEGGDETRRKVTRILRENLDEAFREDSGHDGFSDRFKPAVVKVFRGFTFGTSDDSEIILKDLCRLRAAIFLAIKTSLERFTAAAFLKWRESAREIGAEVYRAAKKRMIQWKQTAGVNWNPKAREVVQLVQSLIDSVERIKMREGGSMVTAEKVLEDARVEEEDLFVQPRVAEINNLLKEPRGGAALGRALVALANRELPGRMGNAYKDVVVRCLQCLDDDEGFILKHKGAEGRVDRKGACDGMEELVVDPLAAASRF